MDLLLLTNGSKYQYVLTSDLQKLIEYVQYKVHRFQSETCGKCFQACPSFETRRRHEELCYKDQGVVIKLPEPEKDDHNFKKLIARWYVLRVIYFDLESLLLPVYGPQLDPQKSRMQTIEIHQPCGYALAVISFGKKDFLKLELRRESNVLKS